MKKYAKVLLLGLALMGLLVLPAGAAEKAESKMLSVELVNGEITMAEGIVFAQGTGRGSRRASLGTGARDENHH